MQGYKLILKVPKLLAFRLLSLAAQKDKMVYSYVHVDAVRNLEFIMVSRPILDTTTDLQKIS